MTIRSRFLLFLFGGALCAIGWFRHDPERHAYPRGWRCRRCGLPADSLDDFDAGAGYVAPVRRTYSRDPSKGFTRSSDWPEDHHHE